MENTDRELLELAAKAAGLKGLIWWEAMGAFQLPGDVPARTWNPLTTDGDALRLAVKIGLRLTIWPNGCQINGGQTDTIFVSAGQAGGCIAAATRRAIVRAAAEIGRSMP